MKISSLKLNNYKSIREMNLSFKDINILIGANGAGKSNLISFFSLLNRIIDKNLQSTIARSGGADNLLYFGRKISPDLKSEITFKNIFDSPFIEGKQEYLNNYSLTLEPNNEDSFFFAEERIGFKQPDHEWKNEHLGVGHNESKLLEQKKLKAKQKGYAGISEYIHKAFEGFKVYHFHDTSNNSPVKQISDIHDNYSLREDGANLASFLFRLQKQHKINYKRIESTIRLIAPYFDRFELRATAMNPEKIRLEWREKDSDKYFNASHLSDGTLRMICLTTLLLQPDPPNTVIIDEPELGLHPYSINVLAGMIKSISKKIQVIMSTQSVTLVNQFTPEDIIIVDRKDGQSVFKHIEESQLKNWLEDYSVGDAWEKNIIGGRP